MTKKYFAEGVVLALSMLVLQACGGGGGGGNGGGGFQQIKIPETERDEGDGSFTSDTQDGCTNDSAEPNDTEGNASPLAVDTSLPLNFCDDPDDFLVVNVVPGETLIAETSALEARADTVIRVLRGDDFSQIGEDDDGGTGLGSRLVFNVPDGLTQVVIHVRAFDSDAIGDDTGYVLRVSRSGGGGLPDFTIGSLLFSGFDDQRIIEFRVEVENLGDEFGSADVGFYMSEDRDVTTDDRFIDFQTTDVIAPAGVFELSGTLQLPTDVNGEFVLGLIVDDVSLVTESNESNNTETLRGISLLGDTPERHCHDDGSEPDDEPGMSAEIFVLETSIPRHCVDGEDWRFFSAKAGSFYDVSTTLLATSSDTVMEVYDEGLNLIGSNDDFNGLASRVSFLSASEQTVFVRLLQFDGSFGSDRIYLLDVIEDDARADLISSIVSLPEGPLQAGSFVPVTIEVSNGGRTAAPATRNTAAAFLETPAGELFDEDDELSFFDLTSIDVPPLEPGESVIVQGQLEVPDANGTFFITSSADTDDIVDEAGESGSDMSNQGSSLRRVIVGGSTVAKQAAADPVGRPARGAKAVQRRGPERSPDRY